MKEIIELKNELAAMNMPTLVDIAKKDYAIPNPDEFTKRELVEEMVGIEYANWGK